MTNMKIFTKHANQYFKSGNLSARRRWIYNKQNNEGKSSESGNGGIIIREKVKTSAIGEGRTRWREGDSHYGIVMIATLTTTNEAMD